MPLGDSSRAGSSRPSALAARAVRCRIGEVNRYGLTAALRGRVAVTAGGRGASPAPLLECLIADADSTDRRLLHDLLVRAGRVAVLGETSDGMDLRRLVRQREPDVLFLDVRMPSDVLDRMLAGDRQLPCLVVLSSALASDATVAYTAGATDFLLKPYTLARLDLAVARTEGRLAELARLGSLRSDDGGAPPSVQAEARRATRETGMLAIASQGRVEYVSPSSIVWVASAGDGARIFISDRVIAARSSLMDLAQRLDPQIFLRTHRGALVNVEMVTRLESTGAGGVVVLSSGQQVPVAKRRIAEVRRALRLSHRRLLPTAPAARSA